MKIRQLRYVDEVVRRGLNVTAAAASLHTSQPGVSKQIRLLEDELGLEIFRREGKHLTEVTAAGQRILEFSTRLLAEAENIARVASEFRDAGRGSLSIATTHTQARYILPRVIERFRQRYPEVALSMHQGSPPQVAKMAAEGLVDLAIATEAVEQQPQLVTLPAYRWNRCVLVPPGHPLDRAATPTLEELARHPLITYNRGFTGRAKLDQAFAARGLQPEVVLTAADADVIKTYVRLGLGVGIVASIACEGKGDDGLRVLPVASLFEASTTHIAFRRGSFLRGYVTDFIGEFAPQWNAELIHTLDGIEDPVQRRRRATELAAEPPLL